MTEDQEVIIKTAEEIEKIRQSSLLVGDTLATVAGAIKPGIRTSDLDKLAETFIRDHHAEPAFKGYNGFPASLCISVNAEVVHGIPGKREVKDGDVISIDCGVKQQGFFGDSAYTFVVGEASETVARLIKVTKECLYIGIGFATTGNRTGDLGASIQDHAEKSGFSVVRELVGHGVGKSLHEKPEVPNYGRRGSGVLLRQGLVIAIEPMINAGKRNIIQLEDGWTIVTADRMPAAHFEHTVVVQPGKADILSSFEKIESEESKNINLSKN